MKAAVPAPVPVAVIVTGEPTLVPLTAHWIVPVVVSGLESVAVKVNGCPNTLGLALDVTVTVGVAVWIANVRLTCGAD